MGRWRLIMVVLIVVAGLLTACSPDEKTVVGESITAHATRVALVEQEYPSIRSMISEYERQLPKRYSQTQVMTIVRLNSLYDGTPTLLSQSLERARSLHASGKYGEATAELSRLDTRLDEFEAFMPQVWSRGRSPYFDPLLAKYSEGLTKLEEARAAVRDLGIDLSTRSIDVWNATHGVRFTRVYSVLEDAQSLLESVDELTRSHLVDDHVLVDYIAVYDGAQNVLDTVRGGNTLAQQIEADARMAWDELDAADAAILAADRYILNSTYHTSQAYGALADVRLLADRARLAFTGDLEQDIQPDYAEAISLAKKVKTGAQEAWLLAATPTHTPTATSTRRPTATPRPSATPEPRVIIVPVIIDDDDDDDYWYGDEDDDPYYNEPTWGYDEPDSYEDDYGDSSYDDYDFGSSDDSWGMDDSYDDYDFGSSPSDDGWYDEPDTFGGDDGWDEEDPW